MNQKPEEVIEQFIALRAKGTPFAQIATQLDVSRPTLLAWSRKHAQRLANERAIELELENSKIKNTNRVRVAQACTLYNRVLEELDKRKLAEIPTDRLALLAYRLNKHIPAGSEELEFCEPFTEQHLAAEGAPDPVLTWKG